MKLLSQAFIAASLLLTPSMVLAESSPQTPKSVTGAFVEITGITLDSTSYETFDNVRVSQSSSNHPVPLSLSFMASSGNVIFRPEFATPQAVNGYSVIANLGVGYLIADLVEVGVTLAGGSASERTSPPGATSGYSYEVSDRTFGVYGRVHTTLEDVVTAEAGGGIGVGLYNFVDKTGNGTVERDAVTLKAGLNVKGIYHLSDVVDLVIAAGFNFRREPLRNEEQNGSSDDAIAIYNYSFSPLGLRLKF